MRLQELLFLITLVPAAFADVEFTSPAAGANVEPGSITVEWKDSGSSPPLSALTSYTLQLIVGGNSDSNSLPLTALVSQGTFSSGSSVTGTVPASIAGPVTNGFYLKMTSTASEGGTVINYSDRFNMPDLTGTTAPQYVTAAGAVSGTNGPPTVNQVANAAPGAAGAGAGAAPAAGAWTIPYALQSGLTKYAPMQGVPPTKITAKNFSPLYSTSAYTLATAFLPEPSILTTLTESQTFSVSSIENTAAAQSQPTGDMAKFLARWKD